MSRSQPVVRHLAEVADGRYAGLAEVTVSWSSALGAGASWWAMVGAAAGLRLRSWRRVRRAAVVGSRSSKVCHGSQVAMTAEAGRSPSLVATAVTWPLRRWMLSTGQPRWTRTLRSSRRAPEPRPGPMIAHIESGAGVERLHLPAPEGALHGQLHCGEGRRLLGYRA